MGDVTKVYLNALQKKYEESILYLKEKVVKSVLLRGPHGIFLLVKASTVRRQGFPFKGGMHKINLTGKKNMMYIVL